jgi:RNase H-fold protein (predicted Holliday junction resolvase)
MLKFIKTSQIAKTLREQTQLLSEIIALEKTVKAYEVRDVVSAIKVNCEPLLRDADSAEIINFVEKIARFGLSLECKMDHELLKQKFSIE